MAIPGTSWIRITMLALGLAAGGTVQAVTVADAPLFISSGATPNIMLLVDNSGSMDNLMWPDAFDPAVAYPDWSPQCTFPDRTVRACWVRTDGNVLYADLPEGTCPRNYKAGSQGGTTKCLRLPDPAGNGNTRFSGNYLDYLFQTYANNTDLSTGPIPTETRIQTARTVASAIVSGNSNLRLGLASYNPPTQSDSGPGGRINAACGTDTSTLLTSISGLKSESNTPLAETLYEVTRYFRGLSSYYNANTTYTSPIQYRCQRNFTVVVTDGFPTYDNQFPTNDPDDVANTSRALPDWDGLSPATQSSQYPLFPAHSDGFKPSGQQATEGYTLFLDDIAKFGQTIDPRSTGNDLSGQPFNDPRFPPRHLSVYTVGFATGNQMLVDAANDGDGLSFTANTADELTDALQAALADVVSRTSSASAVATNSTRLSADSYIYQARFSSSDWSGELLAFPIRPDGTIGPAAWDAGQRMGSPGSRSLFTIDPAAAVGARGKSFEWASLTTTQKNALNLNAAGTRDNNGQARAAWLAGDGTNEAPAGLGFRARRSILGDIVDSDPAFAYREDFGLESLPGAEGSTYPTFRQSNAYLSRPAMLYVGANDGQLHAFDANTGDERFAFFPNALFTQLSKLTDPGYNGKHRYFVNGSPRVGDAYLGGSWQTVLLGSLGAGGRAVFALRVTDPEAFDASDILWEYSDANNQDLGTTMGQPTIARLANGKWAAIVPNGVNSRNQRAVLLILDLETGALIKSIDTQSGSASLPNGLSTPIPVDVDNDRIADYVYAGDQLGNLWKFDLTGTNPNQWKVAFGTTPSPAPLFTACSAATCTNTNRQPITARPEVTARPEGGYLVLFGTGRYFAVGDNVVPANAQVMSFYGVQDRNAKGAAGSPQPVSGGRSVLQQQRVLGTTVVGSDNVRVTTNTVPLASQFGWYLDLPVNGERQVSMPLLRAGRIIFTTLIPTGDPCAYGGTSWLMEIDAVTGSRLPTSPFDLNNDRQFNAQDFGTITTGGTTITVPVSGRQSREGIIKTPSVITAGTLEFKYASGSTGGIDRTVERADESRGRQSWRQLQ